MRIRKKIFLNEGYIYKQDELESNKYIYIIYK